MSENDACAGTEVDSKDVVLRLSLSQCDAMVDKVEYFVFENRLTVCCILLKTGFILAGESAAFNGAAFDAEKGREIAYKNARSKLFMLESYYLKKSHYEMRGVEKVSRDVLLRAACGVDWQQVVANGGAPCFHIQDSQTFCLRAERWPGHEERAIGVHKFVSLADLLTRVPA